MCCQHNDDNDNKSGREESNRTYLPPDHRGDKCDGDPHSP